MTKLLASERMQSVKPGSASLEVGMLLAGGRIGDGDDARTSQRLTLPPP